MRSHASGIKARIVPLRRDKRAPPQPAGSRSPRDGMQASSQARDRLRGRSWDCCQQNQRPDTTRKQPAAEASYVAAPGAREKRSSKAANPAPGSPGPSCCSLARRPESGSRHGDDRPAKRREKVTGNDSVRRCVEGVAGRSGALRSAADGSDGTRTRGLRRDRARLSSAKSPETRGWGLSRSLSRHLFTGRSRPLRAARAANPTRPSLDRGRHRRDSVVGVRQTHRCPGPPSAAIANAHHQSLSPPRHPGEQSNPGFPPSLQTQQERSEGCAGPAP
jgi:hypothetical protein